MEQVAHPAYDYGFSIDMEPLTPPRADGTYAPGTSVTFQLTLKDGAGRRLHPQGSLPTYNEVVFGGNEPGIQYYRAFFDPTTTYYRRKHRERMLMTQIIGPAQHIQPLRSIVELDDFLDPTRTCRRSGRPSATACSPRCRPSPNGRSAALFDRAHLATRPSATRGPRSCPPTPRPAPTSSR